MIKFQQSQALTSHFESFWSIVYFDQLCVYNLFIFAEFQEGQENWEEVKRILRESTKGFLFRKPMFDSHVLLSVTLTRFVYIISCLFTISRKNVFTFSGSWFGILEMLPKLVEFGFSSDTRNFRRIQAVTLISTALHNPNLKGKLPKKLPQNTQKLP